MDCHSLEHFHLLHHPPIPMHRKYYYSTKRTLFSLIAMNLYNQPPTHHNPPNKIPVQTHPSLVNEKALKSRAVFCAICDLNLSIAHTSPRQQLEHVHRALCYTPLPLAPLSLSIRFRRLSLRLCRLFRSLATPILSGLLSIFFITIRNVNVCLGDADEALRGDGGSNSLPLEQLRYGEAVRTGRGSKMAAHRVSVQMKPFAGGSFGDLGGIGKCCRVPSYAFRCTPLSMLFLGGTAGGKTCP